MVYQTLGDLEVHPHNYSRLIRSTGVYHNRINGLALTSLQMERKYWRLAKLQYVYCLVVETQLNF